MSCYLYMVTISWCTVKTHQKGLLIPSCIMHTTVVQCMHVCDKTAYFSIHPIHTDVLVSMLLLLSSRLATLVCCLLISL